LQSKVDLDALLLRVVAWIDWFREPSFSEDTTVAI
jgi:hypothetical protein